MDSKRKILDAIARHKHPPVPLPDLDRLGFISGDQVAAFTATLTAIGGRSFQLGGKMAIAEKVRELWGGRGRVITTLDYLADVGEQVFPGDIIPQRLHDVELAIIEARYAVAENGAVWIPEVLMGHRIVPFICQHLAVVVPIGAILPTMHDAYRLIGSEQYGFACFIAGPSKTADIEQALVLGAHGPRTMTVFILVETT
ncbi:LutC/YkgG family protein [Parapedobacter koreensis]|uniref:L-lactate dehydrogenase complex protein LldG n=1 Tax=Parapedobacter koreensis TaxID=332977 RepID=A0A1H7GEJ8_9SPHI|nr:LUD domain-containing protein [Parapedobacter koreensis]SEK34225.1 L-lactate dehydrogenase complex protein LldG [Parapedobacter koreensis]